MDEQKTEIIAMISKISDRTTLELIHRFLIGILKR